MANLDFTRGVTVTADGKPHPPLLERVLDFSISNGAGSDVAQALDALAGYWVECVAIEVLTAEGATLTVDVGDGADPDGFLNGVDMNAAVGTMYSSVNTYAIGTGQLDVTAAHEVQLYGIFGGKFYGADDTIDVLLNDAAATAKMRLTVALKSMNGVGTVGVAKA